MTERNTMTAIEDALAWLAKQPHDDNLSRTTFAELQATPFVSDVINDGILARIPAPDEAEQSIRAAIIRIRVGSIVNQLWSLSFIIQHDPTSPFLSKGLSRLDGLAAELMQDLAIYGAIAFANSATHHELSMEPVAA